MYPHKEQRTIKLVINDGILTRHLVTLGVSQKLKLILFKYAFILA